MEIFFIGIGGNPISGKSTISNILVKQLNSPLIAIKIEWFYKTEIPKDETYGENWESKFT
jgi:uridine kinase